MKKLGTLLATATLLLACGSGSKKTAERPQEPMTEPAPMAAPSELSTGTDVEADPTADPSMAADRMGADLGAGTAAAAEPVEPEEPAAPTAMANLVSIKDGSAIGTVTFEQDGSMINMSGTFTGLPPGERAIYIHEGGDCTKKGRAIGKHLDPTKAKHGPPSSGTRHAGDLGNVVVDREGNATFQMSTDSVVMEDGRPDSILRRAIVIHGKKDDRKGVNAPLACGVIEMMGGDESRAAAAGTTGATGTTVDEVKPGTAGVGAGNTGGPGTGGAGTGNTGTPGQKGSTDL